MLFQNGQSDVGIYITIAVFFVVGLIMLKIGLIVTKAEARTGIRWTMISFGVQVGMFFFVAAPLILMGISGAFGRQGPAVILILIFLVLALFIDLHVLNVFHQLGIKKALLVFGLMAVPFLIVSFSIIALITR